jgi:hypothetical protein
MDAFKAVHMFNHGMWVNEIVVRVANESDMKLLLTATGTIVSFDKLI